MGGCVNNHWLEEENVGRSAHQLDISRLIGRSAYPILEGQICLPSVKSLLPLSDQYVHFHFHAFSGLALPEVQN